MTTAVDRHIDYVLATNTQYTPMDRVYLTNRILALVGDAAADVAGQMPRSPTLTGWWLRGSPIR